MPTAYHARALGQAQRPQQSPTEWVAALAEGAGRYVAATTDPLRQLADAEAALQSALARGRARNPRANGPRWVRCSRSAWSGSSL